MSTETIWVTTEHLAAAWAATPSIVRLNDLVPASLPSTTPLSKLLQIMDAGGGAITAQPLALDTGVRMGLGFPTPEAQDVDPDDLRAFLGLAQRVEAAHKYMVAWLRSRFPGYPIINTPQLGRGTALTTEEYTHRYPWFRSDLAAGLQFQDRPTGLGGALEAPENPELAALTVDLAQALKTTDEWNAFAVGTASLTPDDRYQLRIARVELQTALRPDAVDRHEPRLAMRRRDFREHHTRAVVSSLTGAAGAYAQAFTNLNDLVDLVAVDIFAQLVRFGRAAVVKPTTLDFDGSAPDRITADVAADDVPMVYLRPGRLARFDHPLVDDLIRIESTGISESEAGIRMRLTGRMLFGTASVAR